jgi:hypothetical protein
MSAWTYRHSDGKAATKIVPPRLRLPYWKGLSADSEEKHEPVSDIDTAVVVSLKVLDPKRPIREADIVASLDTAFLPSECTPRRYPSRAAARALCQIS